MKMQTAFLIPNFMLMQHPKKIICLVIDDEPPARDILKKYIASVDLLQLAGECSNAVETLSFFTEQFC